MNAVDEFVVYDNIEFSKRGWVNRNRILVNGKDDFFTVPLKKDSDYLDIKDRYLAEIWPAERRKILNRIAESYRKAPHFSSVYPIIEKALLFDDFNLFKFIRYSLDKVREYLEIKTPLIVSSTITVDHELRSEQKIIALCKEMGAAMYINPIGGVELYSRDQFKAEAIDLRFIRTNAIPYRQFNNMFIPFLSIIDVMMFNSKEEVKDMLEAFVLE
jgi:hypothetical protein